MIQSARNAAPEIRLGFVADGEEIVQWQHDALMQLKDRFNVVETLRIQPVSGIQHHSRSKLRPPFGRVPELQATTFVPDQVLPLKADVASIEKPDEETLQATKDLELDFILSFSSDCFDRYRFLGDATRWGLWGLCLGAVPYAWASYNRSRNAHPASFLGAIPDRPSLALFRDAKVSVRQYSYTKTVRRLLAIASQWPAEVLRTFQEDPNYEWAAPESRDFGSSTPGFRDDFYYFLKTPWRKITHGWRILAKHDYWHIGLVDRPIHEFLSDPKTVDRVRWIPRPARTRMYADPFVYSDPSGMRLVFEDYDRVKGIAGISTLPLEEDRASEPEPVFSSEHHLSYPYTFKVDDDWFCIPESAGDKQISLHRLDPSTSQWHLDTVLLDDTAGVDTSVIQHAGRWWIFTGRKDDHPDLKLFVYYADELRGPWFPHAANPVKTDDSNSRCGGTLFHQESRLYRPAQDSARTYGGRIVINEVVRLGPSEFEEQAVANIEPSKNWPFPSGLHTLASAGNRTVIDAKRFELDRWELVRRVESVLSRMRRVLVRH